MWECPNCKESMHDCDDYCWNCKTKNPSLKDAPPLPPPAPAAAGAKAGGVGAVSSFGTSGASSARTKKCPFCAEEIRIEAIKCRFCGSALSGDRQKGASTAQAGMASQERVATSRKIIIAALILVLIAVFAIGAFIHRKPLLKLIGSAGRSNPVVIGKDGVEREVAYEEIIEYDGKGNVSKTLKTYPAAEKKGK